jgi:uncharacterized delta-60 repeat protein
MKKTKNRRFAMESLETRRLFTAGLVDTFTDGSSIVKLPAAPTAPLTFNAVAVGPDGRIITADDYGTTNPTVVITRLLSTGEVDTTFGTAGSVTLAGTYVSKVIIDPDGTILLAGSKLQRLSNYGSPDTTFDGGGAITLPFTAAGVAIESDGKILVSGGNNGTAAVYRYTTAGALDTTFGTGGKAALPEESGSVLVGGIAVDPAGGSVVSVAFTGSDNFGVIHLTANGLIDTAFGVDGLAVTTGITGTPTPGQVVVTPDGDLIYQVGTYASGTASSEAFAVSYSIDGDSASDEPLYLSIARASDLAVLPTDQFVVAGWTSVTTAPATKKIVIERFDELLPTDLDLTADTDFGTGGVTVVSYDAPATTTSDQTNLTGNSGWSLAIGPDGKAVIGGTTVEPAHGSTAAVAEFTVTRFTADASTIADTGSISGTIFGDTNGDGTRETGEPGLAGYGCFIDFNGDGVFDSGDVRVFSDATGHYQFLGLAPGAYTVVQNLGSGQAHSFPLGSNSFTATVTGDAVTTGGGFGVVSSSGTITGTLFDDVNGDGVYDTGDTPLAGWGSYLDLNHDGSFDDSDVRELANASGIVTFTGLAAGTYYIEQNTPSGWERTTPSTLPITITLVSGGAATFAIGDKLIPLPKSTGTVKGTVFNDANADGTQDDGEAGLVGRVVYADLTDCGIQNASDPATTTTTGGAFTLTGIPAGSYVIRQVEPAGSRQTTPASGSGIRVTVSETTPVTGLIFGSTTTAEITGTVFYDTNDNGVFNTGEPGLQSVRVFIDLKNNDTYVAGDPNSLTSSAGTFTFNDLAPGTYKIAIEAPSGDKQTAPASNGELTVTVSAGQVSTGSVFGVFAT